MLDTEFLTILGLGLVLGLRHALDTDHLAAVSTVLAQRPSLRASGMIGFSWGLGHTVVLLLVGAVLLVLRVPIAEPFAMAAEFGVGDRKSTRLSSSHMTIAYAVFCLKKKKTRIKLTR